jgi:cell division protein FtsL
MQGCPKADARQRVGGKEIKMEENKLESIIFGLKQTIYEQKAEIERLKSQVEGLSKANIDLWNANQLGFKYSKNPYKGVEVEDE